LINSNHVVLARQFSATIIPKKTKAKKDQKLAATTGPTFTEEEYGVRF
jgi:hypothetical protein